MRNEGNERTLVLNGRGILLAVFIILSLTFALGFMTSNWMRKDEVTVFSGDDLKRIVELETVKGKQENEAEMYVYKDKNGSLMIGWRYVDSD